MDRSVARLDQKMDESYNRLETILKLLLTKRVPISPKGATMQEDNNDVHPLHEDTTVIATL